MTSIDELFYSLENRNCFVLITRSLLFWSKAAHQSRLSSAKGERLLVTAYSHYRSTKPVLVLHNLIVPDARYQATIRQTLKINVVLSNPYSTKENVTTNSKLEL